MTIDGTVEGDVEVWADKLVLGKNARITGTVSAHVSEDPERAKGAQVGALKIDRTENENTSTINDTIGGIVMNAFERLPERDEKIVIDHWEFTVLAADRRVIRQLHVKKAS